MRTIEQYIEQAEKDYHSAVQESPVTVSEMALKAMREDYENKLVAIVSHASYQVAISQLSNEEEYEQGKIDAYLDIIDKIDTK